MCARMFAQRSEWTHHTASRAAKHAEKECATPLQGAHRLNNFKQVLTQVRVTGTCYYSAGLLTWSKPTFPWSVRAENGCNRRACSLAVTVTRSMLQMATQASGNLKCRRWARRRPRVRVQCTRQLPHHAPHAEKPGADIAFASRGADEGPAVT